MIHSNQTKATKSERAGTVLIVNEKKNQVVTILASDSGIRF